MSKFGHPIRDGIERIVNRNTKVALIGCGVWGQKILRTLIQLNVEVVVYDKSESKRELALKLGAHDCIFYSDLLPTLPPDIDGQIFMMHIWQYHPGIRMLADIAKSNELGDLLQIKTVRANWTSPRMDTDTLWNFMSHDLSIFDTILGYIPTPKLACAEKHGGVIRDVTAVLGDQPLCTTHISNRYERKLREVRLHCTGGVAIFHDNEQNCIELIHGKDDSRTFEKEVREINSRSALEVELESFINYLHGGEPPICTLEEGLAIIRTIDKLQTLTQT